VSDLQDRVLEVTAEARLPGLVAVVASANDILESAEAGVRRVEHPEALRVTDPMHLGSCTKGLTATLVAMLVEAGLVSWTTTIGEVFGDSAYADATIEQLLRHEAGLQPFEEDVEFDVLPTLPDEPRSHRRAFSEAVLELDPVNPVGEEFRYSNAGFGVATAMVEHIADESWESMLSSRIFEPLRLDAHIGWPASVDPSAPWGHSAGREGAVAHDPHDGYVIEPSLRPAGDVSMPTTDFIRWLQMNCRGLSGADTIVRSDTLRFMHSALRRAGLGWGVGEKNGVRYSAHTGSAGTFFMVGIIVPTVDRVMALATNAGYEQAEQATLPIVTARLDAWTSV